MKRLGPERQRRSASDGIDAGFRITMSFGMVMVWIFIAAVMWTGDRHHWWFVASVLCGLPFPASLVFAVLTLKSWLDERSWMRAEQMARESAPVGHRGRTPE